MTEWMPVKGFEGRFSILGLAGALLVALAPLSRADDSPPGTRSGGPPSAAQASAGPSAAPARAQTGEPRSTAAAPGQAGLPRAATAAKPGLGPIGGLATIEEFIAGLDPLLKSTAASVLATLIADSRDQALAHGVAPIPDAIRAELTGYVPVEILDAVRWCVACGGPFSLQRNTFLLGQAPAITLDYVVVFQSREDAVGDPSLWAHELKHVMQYRDWGVDGFATRYVDDDSAVESEAAEYRWQWMKKTKYLERKRAKADNAAGHGG